MLSGLLQIPLFHLTFVPVNSSSLNGCQILELKHSLCAFSLLQRTLDSVDWLERRVAVLTQLLSLEATAESPKRFAAAQTAKAVATRIRSTGPVAGKRSGRISPLEGSSCKPAACPSGRLECR